MPSYKISVNGPAEFVAAIPHLLGFHPHQSLVLVALGDHNRIGTILRADLPDPGHEPATLEVMAGRLVSMLARHRQRQMLIAIVDDHTADRTRGETHRALVDAIEIRAAGEGIEMLGTVWAEATTVGAHWHTRDQRGTLPDPASSVLAATTTLAGLVTYASRDELAATFDPADSALAADRAQQLAQPGPTYSARRAIDGLTDALAAAERGEQPTDDPAIIGLVRCLHHPAGRDSALLLTAQHPHTALKLWTHLVRALSGPQRAHPAAMLATALYLSGDGAAAEVAIETALRAMPGHSLAGLLHSAIQTGLPPSRLADLIRSTADQAAPASRGGKP